MDRYHVFRSTYGDEKWWPITPMFGDPYVFTKKKAEEYIANRPGYAYRYKIEPIKEVPTQHKDQEYKRLSGIAEDNIALAMKSYEGGNLDHARAYLTTARYVLDAMKDMIE